MLNIQEILSKGISSMASDIHLMPHSVPVLRVNRQLVYLSEYDALTDQDMHEIFDYFVKDNAEKKISFSKNKLLDINSEHDGKRMRVNVSLTNEIPIFTIRIIEDILPKFESLGLPEIVRRSVFQSQGLILVTGKPNTGKTTTLNALVDEINMHDNRKILMLENPVEFVHVNKKSIIVQKEVGEGRDCNSFGDGAKNALREDCDVLVIGEIRDKETMDAAIDMAESGHLVIGTLHTKSCAETLDRIINFYELNEQIAIKFMISSLLKLVVSQRLLRSMSGDRLIMVPEVMIVDNIVASIIRKDKFTKSELEDAILTGPDKGNVSFMISLANAVVDGHIGYDVALKEIDEKNHEVFTRTMNQIKAKRSWQQ